MWKRIVCSALVVAGTNQLPAHAETLWQFQYTGFERFVDGAALGFLPDYSLAGLFAGTDNNANGVVELSEVMRFAWNGIEYEKDVLPHSGCPYNWCELKSFDYDLATGRLQFSAAWTYTDENGVSGGSGYTTAGDSYEEVYYSNNFGHVSSWVWTDQTRLTVSPVPEPSRVALSVAGLLLIGRLRTRRGEPMRRR